MKIKKFNENTENKEYYTCIIVVNGQINLSGIFETEEDLENWLLNIINKELSAYERDESFDHSLIDDTFINDDGNSVFIDVSDAINWYQDINDADIYYDFDSIIYKNVKAEYGVELIRNTNKYNL